jgi:uncharacterized membrane protein YcaP (DUF421 family)
MRILQQFIDQVFNFDPLSLGAVVFRTVIVYLGLWLLLRLAGKRELGQMSLFDLVVLLVISNAVQNAMVGPDTSLTAGLLAACVLVFINRFLDRSALRFPWLRERLMGTPTLLVHEGKLIRDHLDHEGISEDEVLQALREHGVEDLASVKAAVLEVDGTISVVPADAPSSRTRRRIRGRKPAG